MGAQEQISDRYAFHLLECDHTAGAVSPAAPGGLPSSRPGVWIAERARYKEAGAWRPRLRKASERYLTPLDRVRSILPVPDDLGHVAPLQVPGFDREDLVAAAFDAANVVAGQAGDGADDRHDGMLLCSPSRSLVNSETAGLRDGSAPEVRLRGTPWRGVDAARPRPAVD